MGPRGVLRSMKLPFASCVLVVLVAASCSATPGSGGSPGSTSGPGGSSGASPAVSASAGIAHPSGGGDLVLRISTDGGFVAPGQVLTRIPEFSLYGDGTVVTVGPQIAIYPAPALPNLQMQRVSEAGVQRILEAAREAGLFGVDRQIDFPGIMDAPWTTFTLVADGATHVTRVYAMGASEAVPGSSSGADVARRALAELRAKVTALDAWLAADLLGAQSSYPITRLRVYVDVYQPQGGAQEPSPGYLEWSGTQPLDALGTAVAGLPATRCAVLEGDALAAVLPALRQANGLTGWKSGGRTWALRLRPLLPDESGCAGPGQD